MRQFDEHTITEAVIERLAKTQNARLRTVMSALVGHLHDFVREVQLTEAEWRTAIDFLTRVGQKSDDKRQEFILLSDTLGVSILVDAINHRQPKGVTETTVLGPFYVENPPEQPLGADISGGLQGEKLFIEGKVHSPSGKPVAGAAVDVWHSDNEGYYDVQRNDLSGPALRARFRTDQNGRFWFWTIMPRSYPVPHDGPVGEMLRVTERHPFRPAHVHFRIEAPEFETLVTHVFVAGDPYLESDAVFAVKESLIAEFPQMPPGVAPDGTEMKQPWRCLNYRFGLKPIVEAAEHVSC
ncbi:MAG: intradiol ring-cleavage dioxygenase [Acidobacteriia bacterium]|nr:intradiol ring-cleavage dioxygenase [Methyloceanibacter sp.]MBX5472505.1 intradiol ring-cleavage dioxygenase [Acetobacteraceae bacterium]MCL6492637.1 intradiol ring-cleavage dioxygenase [Terriglobia bacterium]